MESFLHNCYDMSFSISTNTYNPVIFDKKPSVPDMSEFPLFIIRELLDSESISEKDISNLKRKTIYFLSKTKNSEDNIQKINEDFDNSYDTFQDKLHNIEDTFKEIMKNATWNKSKKVPSTNSLSKTSDISIGEEQIKTLGNLFITLYKECVSDENVESYSKGLLSKAVRKLTETHSTMGDGTRLKNLIETIASGIPSYSKQSTLDALINLQSYSMNLFEFVISNRNIGRSKAPIQARDSVMIQSLKNDRNEIINTRNISDPRVQEYLQVSQTQLNKMNEVQTKESKNQVQKFGRGIVKKFFNLSRESGLRTAVINGMATMLTANMESSKTRSKSSLKTSSSSKFKVQTFTEDGEIFVNFSGNLLNTEINGSYSLSEDSISYISKNAYLNIINENDQQKRRISESIGFSDFSNDTLWCSFNTFFFMYTSLMVWFILNPDNMFGIEIEIPEDDNLIFLHSKEYIINMNEILKNATLSSGSSELKDILIYAAAKGWPLFMYG